MNWSYIIIGGAAVLVALLTFLYTVLIGRKNTTIETLKEQNETLKEKNTWLQEQLDLAKANSGDVLIERLAKRIKHLDIELSRLAKDYETNKALIALKEKELDEAKDLWAEVGKELGRMTGDYQELKAKSDLCPHCEAKLVELRDIQEEDWTTSYRQYDCGHVLLDEATVVICPLDPAYPPFNKLELNTKYDEIRKHWSCRYSDNTIQTWHLPMTVAHGKTEREAQYRMQLIHEGRVETEEARKPK